MERAAMEDKREAAVAEAAAASRVRALQEELDSAKDLHRDAKRVHKDAAARCNEASQKVMASEGVDGSPDKVEAVSPRKRGRTGSGAQEPTIQGLPDACKASLEYKRAAAKAAMHIFSVGDTVEGKFGGVKSQGAWFRGAISAVRNDGVAVTYSIDYDDGDKEQGVLSKFVRPPSHEFAADNAAAPGSPQVTKQPAVPQTPPSKPLQPQPPLDPKPLAPVPKPRAASEPPIPAPTPATSSADEFRYNQPWHFSANQCRQHGCTLKHVVLQDFKPGANSGDRNKLRNAVRNGEIAGTNKVPKRNEAGRSTLRDGWWWHEGDPELTIAKRKFNLAR